MDNETVKNNLSFFASKYFFKWSMVRWICGKAFHWIGNYCFSEQEIAMWLRVPNLYQEDSQIVESYLL